MSWVKNKQKNKKKSTYTKYIVAPLWSISHQHDLTFVRQSRAITISGFLYTNTVAKQIYNNTIIKISLSKKKGEKKAYQSDASITLFINRKEAVTAMNGEKTNRWTGKQKIHEISHSIIALFTHYQIDSTFICT